MRYSAGSFAATHLTRRCACHLLLFAAALVLAFALSSVPALAQWGRVRALDFNGGAITDFCPVSSDTALVLAAMPDGFSIYSLDFVSGGISKLVSQTYLEGLVPDGSDAEDLRMYVDPESGLLLLTPRGSAAPPILLNIKSAPYLKRYILGFPEGFNIRDAAFGNGLLYMCPSLNYAAGSSSGLLAFSEASEELAVIHPDKKLASVSNLFFIGTGDPLLLMGTFGLSSTSDSSLAWMTPKGVITPISATSSAILASVSSGHIAWASKAEERAAPGDEQTADYRLTVMSLTDEKDIHSLLLNSRPAWFAMTQSGDEALVISSGNSSEPDLWLVNIASRARTRIRSGVMLAKMSPDGKACFVLPFESNQLELYAP
jgi:hypothetical protein